MYTIQGPEGYIKAWHRTHLFLIPSVSNTDEPDEPPADSNEVSFNGSQSNDNDWFMPSAESKVQSKFKVCTDDLRHRTPCLECQVQLHQYTVCAHGL